MSDVVSAVAGTVADLFGDSVVAEETPNSPTDAAAEAPQVAAPAVPDLNPSLPEDLIDFLDEPDFEDEPVSAVIDEQDEFVDPEELARQNAILKKRLQYAEAKKAEAELTKWKAEAEKYFPYAHLDSISSTSRRGYLKEARRQHEANKALVAPHIEALKAREATLREEVSAQVKAELAEAWGKPNIGGGPSGAPLEAAAAADDLDRARNSRNLARVARALMDGNRI